MSNKPNFAFRSRKPGAWRSGRRRLGGSKHAGQAPQRTSRGLSNGFRGSYRQNPGDPDKSYGSPTKRYPWTVRQETRRANAVARQSRKVNRP